MVLILVNPTLRPGAPRAAPDIANRLNEILGNASLERERDALGPLAIIEPAATGDDFTAAGKYKRDWRSIQCLRE